MSTNKSKNNNKKKALVEKLIKDKKIIEKLDGLLHNFDGKAEGYARKQAGLIGEIFLDNLREKRTDDNGKFIGFTFKKHIEEAIKECKRDGKKDRKDLLVTNGFVRSMLPVEEPEEHRQIWWNRKKQYGYSLLAVLYNYSDWTGTDYREFVLENGYSKLAKEGRKAHKGLAEEQEVDEEEDDKPKGKSSDNEASTEETDEDDDDAEDGDDDADESDDDTDESVDVTASNCILNRKHFKKLAPKELWKTSEALPEKYEGKIVIARVHDDGFEILKTFPKDGTPFHPKKQ